MTSKNEDRTITISLQVTIPCDQQVDVSKVGVRSRRAMSPHGAPQPLWVQRPMTGQDWKVKMVGSGPGVICAYGNGQANADRVYGYCYALGDPFDSLPPADADQASISNNYWLLSQIPGAVVGPCTVRVWYYDGDQLISIDDVPFQGIASTHTDCEGSGTSRAAAPVRRAFFPSRCMAVAGGFSEEVGFFNGTWNMDVKPCIYDVDRVTWQTADSPSGVTVELVADLRDESAALVFRKGTTEIRYQKAAGEWDATNVCDFADVSSRAVPPATCVPATVQIHPGKAP